MKKIFKSITAVALVAAMGCTTAFASVTPGVLDKAHFTEVTDYQLVYSLNSAFISTFQKGTLFHLISNERYSVDTYNNKIFSSMRVFAERNLSVVADQKHGITHKPSNKPDWTFGGAYVEPWATSYYPYYRVFPHVLEMKTGRWYRYTLGCTVNLSNGIAVVPTPASDARFKSAQNAPYTVVFKDCSGVFDVTIKRVY